MCDKIKELEYEISLLEKLIELRRQANSLPCQYPYPYQQPWRVPTIWYGDSYPVTTATLTTSSGGKV